MLLLGNHLVMGNQRVNVALCSVKTQITWLSCLRGFHMGAKMKNEGKRVNLKKIESQIYIMVKYVL